MPPESTKSPVAPVVDRNIRMLLERQRAQARDESLGVRISRRVTGFVGSMTFVYVHLAIYGLWILVNLGWTPLEPFDPTFVQLAMIASVEAIFLSTFVLITQNRMAADAEKNASLDLQVSMLAEHEITQLTTLVIAIARKVGIEDLPEDELHHLQQDVTPGSVLDHIERHQQGS